MVAFILLNRNMSWTKTESQEIQKIQIDLAEVRDQIDEVKEQIRGLPTKDEFYTKMDEVVGELQAMREENTIGSHQISDHEDRIENLENIHPQGQHPPVV